MIQLTKQERVACLTIHNPPVNVLDIAHLQELTSKLQTLAGDKSVAAVVLSGEGKCFSAGASVEEHRQEKAAEMIGAFVTACKTLKEMPVPTVAMIHGSCLGGACELVCGCDFIVSDPEAKFGVPEVSLAFFPPLACVDLPKIIGRQNAAYLVLSGETIDAATAQRMGLVQKLVKKEEWKTVSDRFNSLSLPVLHIAKQAVRQGAEATNWDAVTRLFLDKLYQCEDVQEGIAAFREKRKPVWKHK